MKTFKLLCLFFSASRTYGSARHKQPTDGASGWVVESSISPNSIWTERHIRLSFGEYKPTTTVLTQAVTAVLAAASSTNASKEKTTSSGRIASTATETSLHYEDAACWARRSSG